MKLVFLGPPGVGKGTYSARIMEEMNIVQISTGDLLREAVGNKTELGMKAKGYMDAGELVPDQLIIDLMKERIDGMDSFILDGFPRTIPQAEALEKEIAIDNVVSFEAPEDMIIQRLSGRRMGNDGKIYHIDNNPAPEEVEVTQRDDDKPDAIKNRLVVYKNQTEPLIKYYTEKNKLIKVDATGSVEEIVTNTINKIEE